MDVVSWDRAPETASEWVHVDIVSCVMGTCGRCQLGQATRSSWCMAKAGCVDMEELKDVGGWVGGWVGIVSSRRSRVRVDRRVSVAGRSVLSAGTDCSLEAWMKHGIHSHKTLDTVQPCHLSKLT